jgi:HPr kinase/phosphorylase
MKPTVISADAMFEEFRASLRWEWLAGLGASERQFDPDVISRAQSAADLVGYLNYIHPYRVQILGTREVAYLTRGTKEDCARRVARIVMLEPPMLVLADGQTAPDELLAICERARRSSSTCCVPTCPSTSPSARRCTACSWTSWAWA